jgi:hypothetical protein
MKIPVRVLSLILIAGYFILTLFLFFLPDLYANTDLSLAVQAVVEGKHQNLLLGVRPLLIFIAIIFPLPHSLVLSIISRIFYVFSIFVGHLLVKRMYDERTAYYFPLLWLPNAYFILNAFAPNADVPAIFAGLTIWLVTLRLLQKRNNHGQNVELVLFGLLSGLLGLIRENVLAAVFGAFLALFKEYRSIGIIYIATALILPTFWQLYANLFFGMSLLTQIYTGVSIATTYEYNPVKIIRYFVFGVGPLPLFSLLLGLLYDNDKNRQILIHCFLLPAVGLALGWPATFEPRVALIAFHALIPPSSHGLVILIDSLKKSCVVREKDGYAYNCDNLHTKLVFNLWMAFTNNKSSFSPLWRFL